MHVIAVRLQYLEMELGSLYKTFRGIPGKLLWLAEDGCLYLGDVGLQHSSLLAIGVLIRDGCPKEDFKKRVKPFIKKNSKELAARSVPLRCGGTCNMDGSDPTWEAAAFGLSLTDEVRRSAIRAELLKAAAEHFKSYGGVPDTGTFAIDTGKYPA